MRIHLFLTPNGNIVSFSASLLTKLLIPSETASVLCLGPATSNPHLSALSFPSQELLFLDCFSICDGIKSYIWTYTSSGGICCSALLLQYHEICHPDLFFWSVTPLSLLPLRRNSCKHFPYFCFLPGFSFTVLGCHGQQKMNICISLWFCQERNQQYWIT